MKDSTRKIKKAFSDKDYRHGYVDEFLNAWIATQIKVLRQQRSWSQQELADRANMLQPRISTMENVNYSSWSIKILRKLAEAFDLSLSVSFESFGSRVGDIDKFSREYLERCSFEDDPYFKEKGLVPLSDILRNIGTKSLQRGGDVIDMLLYKERKTASAIDGLTSGQPIESQDIYKNKVS